MPRASSTRAVDVLMFGAIAGCTQPSSRIILRACVREGNAPAGWAGKVACHAPEPSALTWVRKPSSSPV
jgi:hypothetical protein